MRYLLAVALLWLAGCASLAPLPDVTGADAVLIGEQHDAAGQPALQERWVRTLARRGTLAALALEMADRGTSTAGLPVDAPATQVRAALRWNEEAWPWERYGPAVMAAVRAGVPVLGANLPRDAMRGAMAEARFDGLLPGPVWKAQQQAIRRGHCDLLPESQIRPMTRVQLARDEAMAQALVGAAVPGKTVVLIAGGGHADPALGVPQHLPRTFAVRAIVLPSEATGKDYCAELRQQRQGS